MKKSKPMSAAASTLRRMHVARIAGIGSPVGPDDVAEHRRDEFAALTPRQYLQGRRVGERDHVGLLDAGEALDRRAVETHSLGHRELELVDGDDEGLEEPEHVGEPQVDELDFASCTVFMASSLRIVFCHEPLLRQR